MADQTAEEFGRDLADEWEDLVNTVTDASHDLADALRAGQVADEDLGIAREAFVQRMRELFNDITDDARAEVAAS